MAAYLNRVELIGYVGKDPMCTVVGEKNVEMARFSLAITRDYDKEKTDWVNCVCFGNIVSNLIKPYLKKGALIYAVGCLEFSSYEDKEGNKRSSSSVRLSEIKIISTKEVNIKEGTAEDTKEETKVEDTKLEPIDDDSLPF